MNFRFDTGAAKRKPQRFRFVSLLSLALAFVFTPAHLHAQSRHDALLSLIHGGRYDEARAFAAQVAGSEQVRQRNVLFVEALILKRTGRLDQAAGVLGELLDRDPSTARVRQELAHTYYLIGDDDRARYHFEHLKETMTSPALRAAYDHFLVAIRDRRPWRLDGSIGFAPSTNINDGTPDNTVYIDGVPFTNENAAKSGVGLSYNLSGSYRFKLGEQLEWIVGGGISGASYTNSHFDRLRLAGFSELSSETRDWRIAGGIAADRTMSGWKGYSSGIGPYLLARYSLSGRGTLEGRLSWMRRHYDTISAYDGSETNLALSYRHILSSRLAVRAGAAASYIRTRHDFTTYAGIRPSMSVDYIFNRNIILHASAGYERRFYQGAFGFTDTPRRDHRVSLGAGATLRGMEWKGFVPRIDYEYFHVDSNVGLFERRNHSIGLTVTKRY